MQPVQLPCNSQERQVSPEDSKCLKHLSWLSMNCLNDMLICLSRMTGIYFISAFKMDRIRTAEIPF